MILNSEFAEKSGFVRGLQLGRFMLITYNIASSLPARTSILLSLTIKVSSVGIWHASTSVVVTCSVLNASLARHAIRFNGLTAWRAMPHTTTPHSIAKGNSHRNGLLQLGRISSLNRTGPASMIRFGTADVSYVISMDQGLHYSSAILRTQLSS
jgi:hypothetical protein